MPLRRGGPSNAAEHTSPGIGCVETSYPHAPSEERLICVTLADTANDLRPQSRCTPGKHTATMPPASTPITNIHGRNAVDSHADQPGAERTWVKRHPTPNPRSDALTDELAAGTQAVVLHFAQGQPRAKCSAKAASRPFCPPHPSDR
jgi:hypothetical protein